MPRTLTMITTALLTGTLTCSLALAAPRPQAPPRRPTAAALTADERFCAAYGALVYSVAQARDTGVSLTAALAQIRASVQQRPAEAPLLDAYLRLVRSIFAAYTVSPATWRQQTESTCLENLDPRPASTPAPRGDAAN